ncbi:MAG: MerR family transcriptional regulator [Nitrospinota bacterium]
MMDAFNSETARTLTGLSHRQLDYWDRTHLVKPSVREASGRGSARLYSFADLVQLRVVKALRDHGLSLQKIRRSLNYLRRHMPDIETPLANLRFITDGETLFVLARDRKTWLDTLKHGQTVFAVVALGKLAQEVKGEIRGLSHRRRYSVKAGGRPFEVFLEPDLEDGGFIAECPALPGCVSQGDTTAEALSMIADAIEGRLEIETQKPRKRRSA